MSAENEEVDTDLAQEKIQPDAVAKEVETSEGSKDDSIVMATDAERGDDEELKETWMKVPEEWKRDRKTQIR